jgi:hypothetical protein
MLTPSTAPLESLSTQELLHRLRVVRRVGVAVAALAGISRAGLTLLAALVLAICLDYSLRLPGLLRLVLASCLLLLAGVVLYRHVVARLRLPLLSAVARQVQGHTAGPPDCLASGAEFALARTPGYFAGQTITRSAHLAATLSPIRLVRWRWLAGWLASVLLALAILAVGWKTFRSPMICGLERLAWPIMRVYWPRWVQIDSALSGRTVLVASGEPLTLEARILRGSAAVVARLVLDDGNQVRRLEMADLSEGRRSVVVHLTGTATFWFEAGDDDSRAVPGRIRIVARPAVAHAEILVTPPSYTAQPTDRIALGSGPVQVPEGSRLEAHVGLTKPLAEQAHRPSATISLLPADSPEAQPVESLDVRFGRDHQEIETGWWSSRDSLLRAEFTDTDGFANAPLQPWRIAVRIDQLPAVQVQTPVDGIEATPRAVLPLRAMATDDWGIDGVRLAWRVNQDDTESSAAARSSEQVRSIPATQPQRSGDSVNVPIDMPWSLEELALKPGDRVTWSLLVRDNFDLAGRRHEPVRSPVRTIRVVSETDLLQSVLGQLGAARAEIVRMLQPQQDLREMLLAQAGRPQPAGDIDLLHRIADQQARLAGQASKTAADLARATERLLTNRLGRGDLADSSTAAARELTQVRAGPMADVQRLVRAAQLSEAGPAQAGDSVRAAAQAAVGAAEGLENLLRQTAGWTSLESAALGLQDLIDRQTTVQSQTATLGARTLGQSPDVLPGADRQALSELAAAQRELSRRMHQLHADLKTPAAAGEPLQSDQQARLSAAARSLEGPDTSALMTSAADEIASNTTMGAQQRQSSAVHAMQRALAALRGPKDAAQADASRNGQSDPLIGQLKDLARRQTDLRARTVDINSRRDAGGSLDRAGLMRLNQVGQGQADLSGQVDHVKRAATSDAAQRSLDAVAGQMRDAAGQMQAGSSGPPVLDAQQQAAAALSALADALQRAAGGIQEPDGSPSVSATADSPGQKGSRAGQANRPGNGHGPGTDRNQGSSPGQAASAGGKKGEPGGAQAAADSDLPADQAPRAAAALPSTLGQVEAWGFLPPDQRRQVLQGMQSAPPERYRKLTESYWRVLNDSGQ